MLSHPPALFSILCLLALGHPLLGQERTEQAPIPPGPSSQVPAGDLDQDPVLMIRRRLRQGLLTAPGENAGDLRQSLADLGPDGRWPDLDYTLRPDKVVAYSPIAHLRRVKALALAVATGQDLGQPREHLIVALGKALADNLGRTHAAAFSWTDWFFVHIGCPQTLVDCLLILDGMLPKELQERLVAHVRNGLDVPAHAPGRRFAFDGAGQNLVWVANIALRKAALQGDATLMARAFSESATVLDMVHGPGAEGIVADMAWHQHGHQVYSGGYGLWTLPDITTMMELAEGTPWTGSFTPERRARFSRVIRDGHRWFDYRGHMDPGTRGRNIARRGDGKGPGPGLLGRLAKIDPEHAQDYRQWIAHREGGPSGLLGNRHFWLSDMMIHRGTDWYLSAKVISTRTVGTECMNGENLLGKLLPQGATWLLATGEEYTGLAPVWDWSRIPGTTGILGRELEPPRMFAGNNAFAGGVSSGTAGVLAYTATYDDVSVHKAYVFLGNRLVCLGSGLTANRPGQLITSIDQALAVAPGAAVSGDGTEFTAGVDALPRRRGATWVHQGRIGYVLEHPTEVVAGIRIQEGHWGRINHGSEAGGNSQESVALPVFSLWLDHGEGTVDGTYAYVVLPQVDAPATARAATDFAGLKILRNDRQVQAVGTADGHQGGAVFHAPGQIDLASCRIEVERPLLVLAERNSSGLHLQVADPLGRAGQTVVTVDGIPQTLVLGDGPDRGRSVAWDSPPTNP